MCIKRKKAGEEEFDPWKPRAKHPPSRRSSAFEGDLGVRLRAEMLPASQASPRFKAYRKRIITPRRMLNLLLVLVLLGAGWYFGMGPGRQGLEKVLATLIDLALQSSQPTLTPIPSMTPLPLPASETPTPTATRKPTATTAPVTPTLTPTPALTDTPESTCRDFSTVTLDDVGLELCVQGSILNVIENEGNTLIVFSNEAGAFYLITYDVAWPDGSLGSCYQVTGEVMRLLSSPVIVFGYQNLPVECP